MSNFNDGLLYDLETQLSLITAIMRSKKLAAVACSRLAPSDFFGIDREVFEAIAFDPMKWNNAKADKLSDKAKARVRDGMGKSYIKADEFDLDEWIQAIRTLSQLRQLKYEAEAMASKISSESHPGDLSLRFIERVAGINQKHGKKTTVTIASAVSTALEFVEEWVDGNPSADMLRTGFAEIDNRLGGLPKGGGYTVIGARPGMFKTQFALEIFLNVGMDIKASGRRAAAIMFSFEMTEEKLVYRLAQSRSGVSTKDIRMRDRFIANAGQAAYDEAVARYKETALNIQDIGDCLIIDPDASKTGSEMFNQVATMNAMYPDGIDLVIFDYLELANDKNDNNVQRIDEICLAMKLISNQFKCAVIVIAQLSRAVEQRPDKLPILSDLRGSGGIEAMADTVLMPYSPEYYAKWIRGMPQWDGAHKIEGWHKRLADQGGNFAVFVEKGRDSGQMTLIFRLSQRVTQIRDRKRDPITGEVLDPKTGKTLTGRRPTS